MQKMIEARSLETALEFSCRPGLQATHHSSKSNNWIQQVNWKNT